MWSSGVFSLRASLPLTVAALLFLSSDGWAQQELRSGKKGATNPAPVTSTSIDADHQALDVNVAGGTLGDVTISNADGAINDGVSNTIKATVLDLTNSNPLTVGIVDSSGNQISSFGGGTQYQQGDPSTTTDTMTMAGCVRVDTPAVAAGVIDGDRARCMVDSTGRLWVHVGVIDGTVAVTQSGTWNIATLTGITNPVAVTGTFWQATQPVSGTVTVTQGTGTNLHIVCDSGCSSSAGFADNSAFTFGTTAINPIGGVLDDTSTNTATENSAAVARITAQKALHTNLRNNSGTEIGTSGTPIRVDPTGSTTQPVSGTVTANIGTSGSLALDATLTGGTQKSIVRGGAKGTTSAADITSTASGSNHQPIDVVIYDTSGNAITSFGGSGGTSSNFGSAFPTPGTAAGFTDGTNMVAGRVVTSAPSSGDAGLVVRNINPNLAADNSTLSTAKVPVLPGTVSTSAPTWTNGNQSALSLQTDGSVRAAITNTPAVSQSGTWNIGTVTTLPALPANQSVNVAQINGVTPLMGAGNTGTGSPRVTIATDQAALNGLGVYVEDAAETAGGNLSMAGTVRRDTAATSSNASGDNSTLNTDALGLLWTRTIDACSSGAKTFLPINISTATTTEITPSLAGASNNYYICSLVLLTAGANNVALVDDDSDGCGSVTSGLAGGTTSGSGFNMAANSGLTFGNGMGSVFKTNGTNRVVCLVTSAAVQLSGTMSVVAAP